MSDPSAVINAVPPELGHIEAYVASKRVRWFEIFLVVLVAFGSPFVTSIYVFLNGPGASKNIPNMRWLVAIIQEAAALLLLGYVLSRRRLRFKNLGLRWSMLDAGAGLLLAAVAYVVYAVGYLCLSLLHRVIFASTAAGYSGREFFSHPGIMMIPFSLLNPFFEELIVRAYVMTEVIELTGSATLAVALSVGIQLSYHLYYG